MPLGGDNRRNCLGESKKKENFTKKVFLANDSFTKELSVESSKTSIIKTNCGAEIIPNKMEVATPEAVIVKQIEKEDANHL